MFVAACLRFDGSVIRGGGRSRFTWKYDWILTDDYKRKKKKNVSAELKRPGDRKLADVNTVKTNFNFKSDWRNYLSKEIFFYGRS